MAIQFKNLVDVFEQRTGAIATDAYTLTVSTEQTSGATPNPGTGGLKVQYNDGTNDHGFGLVAGTSSSDFLTSGPMHFYTNSDLDTKSATGFAMAIDNFGKVGIGETSPDELLHIKGATPKIKLEHNSGYFESKVEFYSGSNKAAELAAYNNPGFQGINLSYDQGQANTRLQIESTKFRLTTNDPANYQAEVYIDEYVFHQGDPTTKFGFVAQNNFAINTAGTERVRVTSSGDVGIGTTSPDQKLHVHKASAGTVSSNSNAIITAENNANGYIHLLVPDANESGVLFGNPSSSVNGAIVYNNSGTSNGLQFRTSGNSTKMVIDSIGNVGIGTTNPSRQLVVEGGGSSYLSIASGPTSGSHLLMGDTFDDDEAWIQYNNGTNSMSFKVNGLFDVFVLNSDGSIQQGNSSATGQYAAAFGQNNTASSLDAFTTGELNTSSGRQSFTAGFDNLASGNASFAVGGGTTASGENSFAACGTTVASGISSAAFGAFSEATATNAFAINGDNTASGESSFALGVSSSAQALGSIASGLNCSTGAGANGAFAGGVVSNANNQFSIAYGDVANASGRVSQALGYIVNATGNYSFAQGFNNTASGQDAAVFGQQNTVSGAHSITSGFLNTTRNYSSATFGSFNGNVSNSIGSDQFMFGRYLNPPRDNSGTVSSGCVVVGEHNAYLNRVGVKFAVGTGPGVGAEQDSFTVLKDGNVLMEQIVNKNYSSDTAAAAGGVPVGGIYHNAGDLKIRLT